MRGTWVRSCVLLLAATLSVGLLGGCASTTSVSSRPDLSLTAIAAEGQRADLLAVTREQLGVPYRYGGSDRRGFDCSGLVHFSHRSVGLAVPRTALAQHRAATPVRLEALRPGDLLFFDIGAGKGWHVAIYEGGGQFIHAPSSGKTVSRASLGNRYWRDRLIGAGSYL
jgi:cell wall-associated NlpC family hydrolase